MNVQTNVQTTGADYPQPIVVGKKSTREEAPLYVQVSFSPSKENLPGNEIWIKADVYEKLHAQNMVVFEKHKAEQAARSDRGARANPKPFDYDDLPNWNQPYEIMHGGLRFRKEKNPNPLEKQPIYVPVLTQLVASAPVETPTLPQPTPETPVVKAEVTSTRKQNAS